MAFEVRWLRSAQTALTEIWISATDRKQIADAANLIDRSLRDNPMNVGESRGEFLRIAVVFPLAVLFRVLPEDLRVEVTTVRLIGRKS